MGVQLRIDLHDDLAEAARRDPNNPAIKPLADILIRHHATMKCQFDAFADYVAEAEKRGTKNYPLYAWTKATIENPEKKAKYLKILCALGTQRPRWLAYMLRGLRIQERT